MDTEDLAIQSVTRDFTRRVVNACVKKFDRQPGAGFPSDAVSEIHKIGLTIITVPEEWGGSNSLSQAGVVIEELAACCPGFAIIVAASLWSITPLILSVDRIKAKEIFDTYLCHDQSVQLAASILPDTGRQMSINARRDGEGYILEGEATCIINAGVSTLYFVFASASGTNICGVLPSSIPGLQISSPISKLGLSVTPYADIKLDSVFLKDDLILAADSEANHLLNNTDIRRQNLVAAAAVGCTRAVLRESVAYANQRQKGGKLIAKHDAVATMLGEMQTGLKSSQALVNTALKSDCELETAVAARIHATDIACEASLNAVQVFGGYGYMVDLPVEKLMRDSQQLALIGGSNPWLRVYSGGLVSG